MISCSCDMEGPTVWNETKPKAAREHRCSDCGGVITKGEVYTRTSMLYEHQWSTDKRCADCQFIIHEVERTFMQKCGGTWCVYSGDLPISWDDLLEGAEVEDRAQCQRIVGMQNAVAKARGGTRLWSLPLWMQPDDEGTP